MKLSGTFLIKIGKRASRMRAGNTSMKRSGASNIFIAGYMHHTNQQKLQATLIRSSLYSRFLLTEAVKTAKPPNNIGGIYANDLTVGETGLNDPECKVIFLPAESRHDHF